MGEFILYIVFVYVFFYSFCYFYSRSFFFNRKNVGHRIDGKGRCFWRRKPIMNCDGKLISSSVSQRNKIENNLELVSNVDIEAGENV